MQIPKGVRRKLRKGLGSRTSRRSGTKSVGKKSPRTAARMKVAVSRWLEEQQANA